MLAALLNVPRDEREWTIWSLHNRLDHADIRQAILAQKKIALADYNLDPIFPNDVQGWLNRHQQAHVDFTGALGQQGSDLLDVDFNDPKQVESWMWLHYSQHRDGRAALGI